MPSPIIHFEIYVDNLDRAVKFYTKVFDWAFNTIPEVNYTVVFPGGQVHNGRPKIGIDGGMLLRPTSGPMDTKAAPNAYVCTVSVDDLDSVLIKVAANGGRIDTPTHEIPGLGRLAYVRDTEFNIIGILEPEI